MNTPEHLAPRLPLAALTSPSLPGPPSPGVARFPGAPHTGPEVSPPGLPLGALTQPPNPFDVPPTFDALLAQFPPALSADVLRISLVDQAPEPPPAPAPVAEPAPAPAAAPIAPAPAFASAHDFTVPLTFDAPAPAPTPSPVPTESIDPLGVRGEFPILSERVHGHRLVWLDNAATTQKPRAVIDRLTQFHSHENSNIHRAAHTLAARATDAYEGARESVRRFLNAPSAEDVIFVRGATEGINLVAEAWGRSQLKPGDEIVITWLEHHANIVPWQRVAQATGAKLRVAPVDDRGQIVLEAYERLLGPRTRLVSLTQVSNALGTITPSRLMIDLAHRHGALVLLDGAQAVSHMPVDVQGLDCDFFVFSGHKVYGPTGIGAVYGRREILATLPPWQSGGNMIQDVTFEHTVYQKPPARFEAGTGNIADAVGLGTALDWLSNLGLPRVAGHEHDLIVYGTQQLDTIPGLHHVGTATEKAGVLSFVIDGHDTHEIGSFLDRRGIAVRGGHHCAQPILRRLGHESTVRASFGVYNGRDDVDALVDALRALTGGRA